MKNKRSIFYLFVAMLVSSLVIGSFCQTEFRAVPGLKASSPEGKITTFAGTEDFEDCSESDATAQLKKPGMNNCQLQGTDGDTTD